MKPSLLIAVPVLGLLVLVVAIARTRQAPQALGPSNCDAHAQAARTVARPLIAEEPPLPELEALAPLMVVNPAVNTNQEPFGSFTLFPQELKSPDRMAAIGKYLTVVQHASAVLLASSPPSFDPPVWADEDDPTDDEIRAFDKASKEHLTRLKEWGAKTGAGATQRSNALAAVAQARELLAWELGKDGYAAYCQWEMAERFSRVLAVATDPGDAEFPLDKVLDAAMYIAHLWAEGKDYAAIRPEIAQRFGVLDPTIEQVLVEQIQRYSAKPAPPR